MTRPSRDCYQGIRPADGPTRRALQSQLLRDPGRDDLGIGAVQVHRDLALRAERDAFDPGDHLLKLPVARFVRALAVIEQPVEHERGVLRLEDQLAEGG